MRAIKKIDGVWCCYICGAAVPDQSRPHVGRCQCEQQKGKPGLGDIVSAGLEALGITKERVSRIIGKPCNCQKRQQALNEIGKKMGLG
jgi:hypothetical protein